MPFSRLIKIVLTLKEYQSMITSAISGYLSTNNFLFHYIRRWIREVIFQNYNYDILKWPCLCKVKTKATSNAIVCLTVIFMTLVIIVMSWFRDE